MIAEEKAKQLVNKMFNCDLSTPNEAMAMLYPHAKQCALIAVEEMLEDDCFDMGDCYFDERMRYWNDVKQEIIKL